MGDFPNKRDCEHGQLRRNCHICELEQRIKELEQTNQFLIDALNDLCHRAGDAAAKEAGDE